MPSRRRRAEQLGEEPQWRRVLRVDEHGDHRLTWTSCSKIDEMHVYSYHGPRGLG